jgi:hypothetical protein
MIIARIWEQAIDLYGSTAERPLQIIIGNLKTDGARSFLLSVLPRQNVPVIVPMESRIPLVVRDSDAATEIDHLAGSWGRVSIIRGDAQEAEFGDFGSFLDTLRISRQILK